MQGSTFSTMLRPGVPAPALTLLDQHGKSFDLDAAWAQHHVVLFFYPKAETPVCTKEACAFRDVLSNLQACDAVVIGISRDGVKAQLDFATKWSLPYTLLSDVEGKAHKAYKASGLFGLLPGRVTYVIAKGGIISAAYSALFEAEGHVQKALEALAQGSV